VVVVGGRVLGCSCVAISAQEYEAAAATKLDVVAGKMFAFERIAASHNGGQITCACSSSSAHLFLRSLEHRANLEVQ
jgi:hypothetical protein